MKDTRTRDPSVLSSVFAPPTTLQSTNQLTPLSTANTSASSELASSDVSLRRMRWLWLRMTEIFGHRWVSSFGADAARGAGSVWAKGLADITDAQIADGLGRVIVAADEWPPSLPAFRKLCCDIPSLGLVTFELRTPSTRERASSFSWRVWSLLDHHRYSCAGVDIADRLLARAYHLAVEQVMREGSKS